MAPGFLWEHWARAVYWVTKEPSMKLDETPVTPKEPFNCLVRAGKARAILGRIFAEIKPEAIYFTEQHGMRCAKRRAFCIR
jgi:hypothetical protein